MQGVKKKVMYPCAICDQASDDRMIKCTKGCGLWVHIDCVHGMTKQEFNEYLSIYEYFLCPNCVYSKDEGLFDYRKCLERLMQSPNAETCSSEQRLMFLYKSCPSPLPAEPTNISVPIDKVSIGILKRFHGVVLDQYLPLNIIEDGNSLYRAASLALYGTQSYHIYLRICTSIEIICHIKTYDRTSLSVDPNIVHLQVPSSSVDEILVSALKVGDAADLVHMYALSAALGLVIQSYHPPTSSIFLNNPNTRTIVGRSVCSSGSPRFIVMWTMMTMPDGPMDFQPNHFVYLAPINKNTNDNFYSTRSILEASVNNEAFNEIDLHYLKNEIISQSSSVYCESLLNWVDEETKFIIPDKCNCDDQLSYLQPDGIEPLPRMEGLWTSEVIELLLMKTPTMVIFPRIPRCIKNNVYFVVNNQLNVDRRKKFGLTSKFEDDCGQWKSNVNKTCTIPYLKENTGRLRRVFWIASQQSYCREVKVGKKREYHSIQPQPKKEDVIVVRRNYNNLAANKDYKRRITWLEDTPNNICVVEYFGEHKVGKPHGNCKTPNSAAPYIRKVSSVMDSISDSVRTVKRKKVYNQLTMTVDTNNSPCDSNVVNKKKYSVRQLERQKTGILEYVNFADEIQAVSNSIQNEAENCVPSNIMYNDPQIQKLKPFNCNGVAGSVPPFNDTCNIGSNNKRNSCKYKNAKRKSLRRKK